MPPQQQSGGCQSNRRHDQLWNQPLLLPSLCQHRWIRSMKSAASFCFSLPLSSPCLPVSQSPSLPVSRPGNSRRQFRTNQFPYFRGNKWTEKRTLPCHGLTELQECRKPPDQPASSIPVELGQCVDAVLGPLCERAQAPGLRLGPGQRHRQRDSLFVPRLSTQLYAGRIG
jgi:hypothetical protein